VETINLIQSSGFCTTKSRHVIFDTVPRLYGPFIIEPGTFIEFPYGAIFHAGSSIKVEHERAPFTPLEMMR
jgi:hypothetical protein